MLKVRAFPRACYLDLPANSCLPLGSRGRSATRGKSLVPGFFFEFANLSIPGGYDDSRRRSRSPISNTRRLSAIDQDVLDILCRGPDKNVHARTRFVYDLQVLSEEFKRAIVREYNKLGQKYCKFFFYGLRVRCRS